jgi:salicylate hydroxylase
MPQHKTTRPDEAKLNVFLPKPFLSGYTSPFTNTCDRSSLSPQASAESAQPYPVHSPATPYIFFESTSEVGEIGAGIQVLPNSSKVLKHCGLEPLLTLASPKRANLIRWKEGSRLSSIDFASSAAKYPGTHYWDFHWADLYRTLIERMVQLSGTVTRGAGAVDVRTNVEGVKSSAMVVLAYGRKMRADLVVGADGIHSRMREILVGKP